MDRYVVREQRSGGEFPEGNQMIAFSATSSRPGNNITIPENNVYYSAYGGEVQSTNVQQLGTHRLVPPHVQTYSSNVIQAQGQIVSGIDPRYLAEYADNNAAYLQTMHGVNTPSPAEVTTFGSDYQNRNFIGAVTYNRNFNKTQANNQNFNRVEANNHNNFNRVEANSNMNNNQMNNANFNGAQITNPNFNETGVNNHSFIKNETNNQNFNRVGINNNNFNRVEANNRNVNKNYNVAQTTTNPSFNGANLNTSNFNKNEMANPNYNRADANNNFNRVQNNNNQSNFNRGQNNNRNFNGAGTINQHFKGAEKNENKLSVPQIMPNVASKKQTEIDLSKHELQNQVKTRGEKLKELQKSGTRVFSGPVEKILKWHKSIQDIGAMVFYEIVGKCVTVRAGESCAKNLVVRDENGPAIQIVYYEIDFFLPELKPPCTVRVIGRMMPGTTRFQAFNVRPATGDDVATLPRRAAVAAHHVAKLSKEYGVEVLTLK
ncbi:putative uncharacterized protein DDB_G0289263 [Maniola jurtina]|uniref:putative uncharacterized protein DDB_G0289263 n=1 Tax=Maniola jurtina TaxID=191418 RepID=UPI001E68E2DC|nr:putative uncharacterized protein DDB_G0289263 [Maniola jurtina]